MKKLYQQYKHGIPVLVYLVIYLVWFFFLENKVTTYRLIHTTMDDKIPFCEFFVIPYFTWFLYVTVCVGIAFFKDKDAYFKSLVFLFTGMTLFLIISTLWPNGHNLRPLAMPRDNFCSRLVQGLYRTDTPTNLWPSIHVYNSIGAHLCIMNCNFTRHKKKIRTVSFVISISIILSTMFIKQHSLFDVCTAILMSLLMAILVYRHEILESVGIIKEREKLGNRIVFK